MVLNYGKTKSFSKIDLSEQLPEVVWVEGGERADVVVGHGDGLPAAAAFLFHCLLDLSLHQKRPSTKSILKSVTCTALAIYFPLL